MVRTGCIHASAGEQIPVSAGRSGQLTSARAATDPDDMLLVHSLLFELLYHVLQTEWLAGRGTLFGTLVALATAGYVTDINVRIWSDREDGGLTAGAVPLDTFMEQQLVRTL